MFEEVIIEIASPALSGDCSVSINSFELYLDIFHLGPWEYPYSSAVFLHRPLDPSSQDLIKTYRHGLPLPPLSEILLPNLLLIDMMSSIWVVHGPGEVARVPSAGSYGERGAICPLLGGFFNL